MNDVNDKLIEGLEEAKIKIAELENELEGNNVIYKMAMKSIQKVSIVNDMLTFDGFVPKKQIFIGSYYYAFIQDKDCRHFRETIHSKGFTLWINNENDDISGNVWGEVSDLTELKVWEYQEIKSYAVAIGWIAEEEDLFI